MSKSIALYRMPNQSDFYSLLSEQGIEVNSNKNEGFFFSNFETGEIYSLKNPKIEKNTFPEFDWFFNEPEKEIDKEEYITKVNNISKSIQNGEYKKVVFSKVKNIPKNSDFSTQHVFEKMCKNYPDAFVYCISSPETGTWMGASPELLLKKVGNAYKTVSLAGTREETVMWTDKERAEQQVVTKYILNKINPFSSLVKVSKPYDLNTGTVIHLKSDIEFQLKENQHIWGLVELLHPTPAVCGIPTKKARKYINELEPHSRNLYTGFIGPMGLNNQASLFVNLRCMQICSHHISLYVGGGIMGNSNAEKEWIETENKAKTLLKVL